MRHAPIIASLVGVATVIGLAGCSQADTSTISGSPAPSSSQSSTAIASATATPTSSARSTPAPSPSISAAVGAAQSKFDAANKRLAASNSSATDDQIVAALAAAGFAKARMQITPDETTIGRRVDSIEVSVLVDKTCLIGEYRGSAYNSTTAPVLASGKCLVGTTAAIH
jgi:hypothetical protein